LYTSGIENNALQDPDAKITSIKSANKFFSEDKDHSFEAKVRAALYELKPE
jgi:hypothetical protein